jgi:ubiquinone/menaquinone biosynthesis C-methylase UbiE/pimeloyl-ACP methyl ester carboxylesterase
LIESKFISFTNRRKKNLVAVFDCPSDRKNRAELPLIIIPPAFGETKADSIALSYFLAANGFGVLRYDGTNHLGESEGDIFGFTMDSGRDDLIATIEFVTREFSPSCIGIVARSLGWRFSLKVAAKDPRVSFLLGIGGIVNLQASIHAAYQDDLVELFIQRRYHGTKIEDIFGFEISRDFIDNAIASGYHNLQTTMKDFSAMTKPAVYMHAEKDVWVSESDVTLALACSGGKTEFILIPDVLHDIGENPEAALKVFNNTVISCKQFLCNETVAPNEVRKPDVRLVSSQNRVERERLRKAESLSENEKEFWKVYLKKYTIINHSEDYSEYLDSVMNACGKLTGHEKILDAGCGPGFLGSWILCAYGKSGFSYVGLDLVDNVLVDARRLHADIYSDMPGVNRSAGQSWAYVCGNLDSPKSEQKRFICFKDESFDIVICSLLISYLKEPQEFLREIRRVLKPGGRVVVTTLKPHADLSMIFHNFVTVDRSMNEKIKARELMSSAGMIKMKERLGYYHFFSESELNVLLRESGFEKVSVRRSLGDQSNIGVGVR